MADYDALTAHLRAFGGDVWLATLADIETVVGPLPASARRHGAWWANDPNPGRHSRAWLSVGFVTRRVNLAAGTVEFHRTGMIAAVTTTALKPKAAKARSVHAVPCVRTDVADAALVACAKTKRDHAAPAADLYISPLFEKSRRHAEHHAKAWFILSARHGLVQPNTRLEPYELTLADMSSADIETWADRVVSDLARALPPPAHLMFLAGQNYQRPLRRRLLALGYAVSDPLEGLPIGRRMAWLDGTPSPAASGDMLAAFHGEFDRLLDGLGGGVELATCHGRMNWPKRGVYFFMEPDEMRPDTPTRPRIVRVGTHGLTAGSKSTLWGRLSQHRGPAGGLGNHTVSVFRRHTGAALVRRDPGRFRDDPWRDDPPADIAGAQALEAAVSAYLGRMKLVWLDIEDEPSPLSERGYIERNAIGLLSAGTSPASPSWLGHHSDRESVRRSGLWNVNHVGEAVDGGFVARFAQLVTRTLASAPAR